MRRSSTFRKKTGVIPLEHYASRVDERTALVSSAHVCYRNGAQQDAKAVTKLAHQRGALSLLDAYQSLGTMPIDVKALGVDVMVGGALKYLLGSSGLAFMYVREDLIGRLEPTATGWFAQADVMALDIYAHDPSGSARRFESGTPPNPNLYAGLAGLELVRSVGTEAIAAHLRELTGRAEKRRSRKGLLRGDARRARRDGGYQGAGRRSGGGETCREGCDRLEP